MQATYSTKQLAEIVGVHVNTLRFYEEIGFLTKPSRKENGYRIYTDLQREQCRVIRLAMRAEVLQNGLRKKAVDIVRLCAEQKYDDCISASTEYSAMIQNEILSAKTAIASVQDILGSSKEHGTTLLGRKETAKSLHITTETLRNWERSGLICVGKRENGYCVYSEKDIERLNIIRTLRCANYSLSAILRLMKGLDKNPEQSVEELLNNPGPDEDIVSVCDKLIVSLQNTAENAAELTDMLKRIKAKFSTLH